jgi:hypothetical protein
LLRQANTAPHSTVPAIGYYTPGGANRRCGQVCVFPCLPKRTCENGGLRDEPAGLPRQQGLGRAWGAAKIGKSTPCKGRPAATSVRALPSPHGRPRRGATRIGKSTPCKGIRRPRERARACPSHRLPSKGGAKIGKSTHAKGARRPRASARFPSPHRRPRKGGGENWKSTPCKGRPAATRASARLPLAQAPLGRGRRKLENQPHAKGTRRPRERARFPLRTGASEGADENWKINPMQWAPGGRPVALTDNSEN